jgi:hypothetical protein
MTRSMSKYEKAFRTRGEPAAVAESVVDPDAIVDEGPHDHSAEEPTSVVLSEAVMSEPEVGRGSVTLTFTSSNIKGAELDVSTGIVTVAFKNDTTYRYANFTAELMAEWGAAASAGSWFHQKVRMRAAAHPVVADAAPITDADPAKE